MKIFCNDLKEFLDEIKCSLSRVTPFPIILHVGSAKTHLSLRGCTGRSESLLSTSRRFEALVDGMDVQADLLSSVGAYLIL